MKAKVNGSFFLYFNEFVMVSDLDTVASTFTFWGTFDPTDDQQRVLYKPLSYPKVEFYQDDDTLFFTGTIVTVNLASGSEPQKVSVSGYSSGGVLEDCTIPYEAYPLQSLNRSLKEIAQRLLSFFKLTLVISPNVAQVCDMIYKKSTASPSDSVKDYLAKLAAQRNVIISHDANGNVIMFRPDTKAKPVGWFDTSNITEVMNLVVNGQRIHSSLTSVRQPGKKNVAADTSLEATDTITNNLVNAYRPYVHILSSGTETDTASGVKNAFSNELKSLQVDFKLSNWQLIYPGDIIMFSNPELFITEQARLMVLNITREEDSSGQMMSITAVLPETFTGEQPVNVFN